MTGLDNTLPPTLFSEKLSLVTHHHLDDWNYGQRDFFFVQLCESYDVDKYLCTPTTESSTTSSAPLTPEELKVDKIVLSWILFTLFDSLRARIVVARPKSAKEAWSLISDIVKDNKRSRTNTLKGELRSIKLGDQSMESDSLFLKNLITFDKYNQFVLHALGKDTFTDPKLPVRSLLIAEEMRCKPWKPCFIFAKENCGYGDSCRYVHDANARIPNATNGFNKGRKTSEKPHQ
ncbi:ribonuclease H-like domain-containing protein [Tanacetum coccineum]